MNKVVIEIANKISKLNNTIIELERDLAVAIENRRLLHSIKELIEENCDVNIVEKEK